MSGHVVLPSCLFFPLLPPPRVPFCCPALALTPAAPWSCGAIMENLQHRAEITERIRDCIIYFYTSSSDKTRDY
ncbi:unnamed protein product [Urochloa humidicola]